MAPIWPLVIEIPVRPIGKGRPRFGKNRVVYTPEKTRTFEVMLAWEAKLAMRGRPLMTGPVRIRITACFKARNKKEFLTPHIKKPDCDNILKTLDALHNIVFKNDSQISDSHIKKINGKRDFLRIELEPDAIV